MPIQENKDRINRLIEIPNTGDFSSVDELISDNFTYHASTGEEYRGRDGFRELVSTYRQAFPDLELRPQEMVAEGETVIVLFEQSGTHRGSLMGIEPTGNKVSVPMFSRAKFADGKVVDLYEVFDMLDFLDQLGAIDEKSVLPGGMQPPSGTERPRPRV